MMVSKAVEGRICVLLLVASLFLLCGNRGWVFVDSLGVNWGDISRQPLPAAMVVKMLLDNNINKVKLFDADNNVLQALEGTNIEVMVAAPNEMLYDLATDYRAALKWVRRNVTRFVHEGGVNIKYVAVGNEPFLIAYNGSYLNTTFPALKNIHQALINDGLGGKVLATVPFNADILDSVQYPSQGRFRPEIAELMTEMTLFLNSTGAPFSLNIYPFLSLALNPDFPIDYAFFGASSNPLVDPAGPIYYNVFDGNYDMLVTALSRVGCTDMPIVIGEIGWPTDGNVYASKSYAQRFNQQLIGHLLSTTGTPLRPGQPIEAYLFGLLDENLKSIDPGAFERHWGIFAYDGQPKYQLDLSGQGLNTGLVGAQGVEYLPYRWCVVNPLADKTNIVPNIEFACERTDCTALTYGSSCSFLDPDGNASYAFNNYYQFNAQAPTACNFDGIATLVTVDPSESTCEFMVGLNYKPLDGSASINHPSRLYVTAFTACITFVFVRLLR